MKKYILKTDKHFLARERESARNFGREARRLGESVATNFYEKGSEEHFEFMMGFYEKDCGFNK